MTSNFSSDSYPDSSSPSSQTKADDVLLGLTTDIVMSYCLVCLHLLDEAAQAAALDRVHSDDYPWPHRHYSEDGSEECLTCGVFWVSSIGYEWRIPDGTVTLSPTGTLSVAEFIKANPRFAHCAIYDDRYDLR
jgi:hypothetical protein